MKHKNVRSNVKKMLKGSGIVVDKNNDRSKRGVKKTVNRGEPK